MMRGVENDNSTTDYSYEQSTETETDVAGGILTTPHGPIYLHKIMKSTAGFSLLVNRCRRSSSKISDHWEIISCCIGDGKFSQ
ncbi:hypothetical protein T05_1749 [Trichinella murrelli]|uniref:Uncharacterized protein n=1 Tax=Trichinella murrelli TaxID=144512 RepID=A0A0V0TEX1_9BILA|nr:hypothetical protein T05_1749 [Trichinella murrelli]